MIPRNSEIQVMTPTKKHTAYSLVISWILLGPLVYFASNGSLWFQSEDANNVLSSRYGALATQSQGAQAQALSILVLGTALCFCLAAGKTISRMFCNNVGFSGLVGLTVLSSVWSQFPARSIHCAVVLAVNTAFVFYLHQHFNQEQKLQLIYMAGWASLLFSIYLSLFVPSCGIDRAFVTPSWRGMYGQKNLCAMATLFLLSVAFYLPVRSLMAKAAHAAYIVLSIVLIMMTRSLTSEVILVSMILYVIATRTIQRFNAKDRIVGMILVACMLLAIAGAGVSYWPQLTYLCGRDPTLTGRSGIWQAAWASLMKHPIRGYGYRAFWSGYQGESANVAFESGWAVSSAHNAFLQVWLDLGFLGLAGVVYVLLRSVSNSISYLRRESSAYRGWCACIIFLTVALSLDEGEMMIPNGLLWMLFVLASIGIGETVATRDLPRFN